MKKNSTFGILVIFALAFLLGTIANIYFIFNPSNYVPPEFNPYSFWDLSLLFTSVFVLIALLFTAQKVKNIYAKIFWLFVSGIFLLGSMKQYLFEGKYVASQTISALVSGIVLLIILIFLFLYRKYKFDILEGLKKEKA
jgi:hypothetical protein